LFLYFIHLILLLTSVYIILGLRYEKSKQKMPPWPTQSPTPTTATHHAPYLLETTHNDPSLT
jgi:hypothetical protein